MSEPQRGERIARSLDSPSPHERGSGFARDDKGLVMIGRQGADATKISVKD
jgi:hypothetical protein